MKIRFTNHFLPAVGISILAASPCLAQGAVVPAPAPTAPKRAWQIRLNYVRPSVMAWWLDPQNHVQPAGATPRPLLQGAPWALPSGVDRIVAIDPQNALLVFGTDEGMRKIQDTVLFLDRPQDKIPLQSIPQSQINVGVRLITIQNEALTGIWAALSGQTGRATPAVAFLKTGEENALYEQIARSQARLHSLKNYTLSSRTPQILSFGSSASKPGWQQRWERDFTSAMPVIPPPETGDMKVFPGKNGPNSSVPAPLDNLKMQITPASQPNNSVSLEVRELEAKGILGRATSARFELQTGDVLALALPDSTPGTSAFLLFTARLSTQFAPLYRAPNLGDVPNIGGLFRLPPAPRPAP